jgi:asparagine synthase (glutamine-hydrolysing)
MCGIAGLWNPSLSKEQTHERAKQMIESMPHRGPDSTAIVAADGWALAHARLAIIDLSGGHQPLWNEDKSIAVIGNNEIYNAPVLRQELIRAGHVFKTGSDTEVVVHGWEMWGDALFERLNGMFALAILDTRRRQLVLARDPVGIKPMHWAERGGSLFFASEIKAILANSDFPAIANPESIHLFLNLRYVPNDQTLFQGIQRLPPGSFLRVTAEGKQHACFYQIPSKPRRSLQYRESVSELKDQLHRAVERHLLSDVGVSAYLSGGIDSSLVATLASKVDPKLHTFCLGFNEPTDENQQAKELATYLEVSHTDLHLTQSPLDRFIEVLWHVEEPKVNLLQGFALAEQVSKTFKVALSGLGGDELFAGYTNNDILYPMIRLQRFLPVLPKGLAHWSGLQERFQSGPLDHYFRAAELGLNLGDPLGFYAVLRNAFDHSPYWMRTIYGDERSEWFGATRSALAPYFDAENPDLMNELLRLEARTKLVNDFLLTEDRVSMAHSLEVRVPLLDKELVDFAFSMPSHWKFAPGNKKRILKDAAAQLLPSFVLHRKKWGFSINPVILFDAQLRTFLARTLTRETTAQHGFNWKWVETILSRKSDARLRWHYFTLWTMAGIVLWHQLFIEGKKSELLPLRSDKGVDRLDRTPSTQRRSAHA